MRRPASVGAAAGAAAGGAPRSRAASVTRFAAAAVLLAACCAVLPTVPWEQWGQLLLFVIALLTIVGLQIVWTHVWLIATGACWLMGWGFGIGTGAAVGVLIGVPWYMLHIVSWLPGVLQEPVWSRGCRGWLDWIMKDIFGIDYGFDNLIKDLSPTGTVPRMFYFYCYMIDFSVHLVPGLMLLQLSAEHITPATIAAAYLLSRAWSVCITAHHLQIDWAAFRRGEFRASRRSQRVTPWCTEGVIHGIYGFIPHMPQSLIAFAWALESAVMPAIFGVAMRWDGDERADVFRRFGGSDFVGMSGLLWLEGLCVAVGGAAAVGVVLCAGSHSRHH